MTERIQVNLQRTFNEVLETHNEYIELLANNAPPWSLQVKIEMKTLLQLIKQSHHFMLQALDKWEDTAKKIKDADQRKAEYELLDAWRDNNEHRKLMKELAKTILKGDQYLTMENDDDNISIQSDSTHSTNRICVTATVPQIKLPKFNGDYLKWSPFWQRFEHAIHSGPYPKIEKLISLLGFLEGRALEEVEGFTVAEENYDTIVATLKNRFGNKTLIIMELQEKLRRIETAKSNSESLRSTVNLICNMCRQLQNLGVDIENESMKLDIISKLPHREKQKLKWWIISESENATISTLMEKMKRMALKAELAPTHETTSSINFQRSNTRFDSHPVSFDSQPIKSRFDSNRASFNLEPLNSSEPNEKPNNDKNKCSLCSGNHWSAYCSKFTTPDEKLKQLRLKNYCTKCSRSNHETKNCLSKAVCRICNGNHYQFLCKDIRASNQSSALITAEKKQGPLLTKDVTVVNPVTKETTETVVIFDSGSQKSYVSDAIIDKLKLEKNTEEKVNVIGFGAKASTFKSSMVKFKIKSEDGFKEIYGNSAKCIATTVPVLYTADSDSNNINMVYKTPGILIGMDYFFQFINSFEKDETGIYIVNSCVGKMVCKNIMNDGKNIVTSLANEPFKKLDEAGSDRMKICNIKETMKQNTTKNEEKACCNKSDIQNDIKPKSVINEKIMQSRSKNEGKSINHERAATASIDNAAKSLKSEKLLSPNVFNEENTYGQNCEPNKSRNYKKLQEINCVKKVTTEKDVIFDNGLNHFRKPWLSTDVADQLKCEKLQEENHQNSGKEFISNGDSAKAKFHHRHKYIRQPSFLTTVSDVKDAKLDAQKPACGGEGLGKHLKKTMEILSRSKDNREKVVPSVTGELKKEYELKPKLKWKKSWKYKPPKYKSI